MKTRHWFALLAVLLTTAAAPLRAGTISDTFSGKLCTYQNGDLAPFDTSTLGEIKFFAFYFAKQSSSTCRRVTPELVSFYGKTKKNNPAFELIFVSLDKSREMMIDTLKSFRMEWPVIGYRETPKEISSLADKGIPCLVLVDENGQVLSHSFEGSRYLELEQVMMDIEKRLRKYKNSGGASGTGQGKAFDDFFKKTQP